MTTEPKTQIKRVLIVGGVHGNEFTGVFLVKKFQRQPNLVYRNSFETSLLFANPEAFAANRRYLDIDLNRAFKPNDLQNLTLTNHENIRARKINDEFGENGTTPVDVIIDLHTTTSNMGLTLITDENHFNLRFVAYLKKLHPSVNIYIIPKTPKSSSLSTISQLGFTLEVGAIAQGTLNAELFQKSEKIVQDSLNYLEKYNQEEVLTFDKNLTLYWHSHNIDYPRDKDGEMQGIIHPQLDSQDYQPLNPGDQMFLTFDGETINYEGEMTVYPVFINEAAYYEKGIAMSITNREELVL